MADDDDLPPPPPPPPAPRSVWNWKPVTPETIEKEEAVTTGKCTTQPPPVDVTRMPDE